MIQLVKYIKILRKNKKLGGNNLITQEKRQTIKLVVAIFILVIILAFVGIVMMKYEVEGETNMPFTLSKIVVVSSAEGQENEESDLKWDFSINFLKQELARCDDLGVSKMVLHPGSAVGLPKDEALENIKDGLNLILKEGYHCRILLETMAGKGSECGASLAELKYLITEVNYPIGICLDTCHLNDSGININHFDEYLTEFDQEIGLEKIGCVHVNDSKNPLASHKDRHANIGYGTIGFNTLLHVIYHEKLTNVPKILETPYVGESLEDKNRIYPPYRFEIKMIREKTFDNDLLQHIHAYYKR